MPNETLSGNPLCICLFIGLVQLWLCCIDRRKLACRRRSIKANAQKTTTSAGREGLMQV